MFSPGSPVCVARGGDLTSELAFGNHPSVTSHAAVVLHGRALVFDSRVEADVLGLRVFPLAVVLEPKFRIIHDLTFARAGSRTSVNDDTNSYFTPPCELGQVLCGVLVCVLIFATAAR